jgi:hypothetical protein
VATNFELVPYTADVNRVGFALFGVCIGGFEALLEQPLRITSQHSAIELAVLPWWRIGVAALAVFINDFTYSE